MAQSVDLSFLETPVIRAYLFYSGVLVVKMMFMSALTGLTRYRYKAFANPEDGARLKVKPRTDDNVERVRRAHLNDLENITLFFIVGFIYSLTNPSPAWAILLFRVYTAARFIHTFVYAIVAVPQPARVLSFSTGLFITGYMAAFANPEDGARLKVKPRIDDNVERVRRAHLNDLENITLFFVVGFIYSLTKPAVAWATLLFRVYTAARFIHTFVYAVYVLPQRARGLSWTTGYLITGYMALKSILYFA